MSLHVTCACGKSFAAQPNLAGKTVACPACGGSLTIPNAAPASVLTPLPSGIRVSCTCGKSFSAKPELAGKKVKCPACSSAITIPIPTAAKQTTASAKPALPTGQRTTAGADIWGVDGLDTLTSDDPLGLGGFDERTVATAPSNKLAAKPAPLRPTAKKSTSGTNPALLIGLGIGGGVVVLALIVVLMFTVILPAMNSTSATNQTALNERGIVPPGTVAPNGSAAGGQPTTPGGPPSGGPPSAAQLAPTPKEWITFNSSRDGYSVLFPSQPQERNDSQQGATTTIASCELGAARYSVYVRRPPAEVANSPFFSIVESLDATINAELKSSQGQVVSRKKVLFDGHPGVELTFKMNQNGRELKAYSRHYAVDKTVYSLIIESFDEPGSADQEKFFDSFKITDESAAAAPKNVAGSTPSSGPGGPGGFGPGGPGGFRGGPPGSTPPSGVGGPGGGPSPGGPGGGFRGGPPGSTPPSGIGGPGGQGPSPGSPPGGFRSGPPG